MKTNDPPDYLQNAFRDELIESGAEHAFGVSSLSEEISRFRFYLQTLEEFIASQKRSEINSLDEETRSLPADQRPGFWAWYYPVHWDEIFATRLRSSFLISLISFAETQLSQICRDTGIIARSGLRMNDLRGNILERSRTFLEVFGEFGKPLKPQWELVARICDVRNALVHNNGRILGYQHEKRLCQFVSVQSGLSQEHDIIEIEKEFCVFCLDKIESFVRALREELKDLCERVKRSELE